MSEHPVVVVHGFFSPALANLPVHLAFRRLGMRTYDVPIPGWNTQDVTKSSLLLGSRVEEILRETGAPRVDLVGISMGGVIAVHYVRCRGGHAKVRRAVTLGSPLSGADVATFLSSLPFVDLVAARQMARSSEVIRAIGEGPENADEIVSVYAEGDHVVSRDSARLRGARLVKAPVGRSPFGHYQLVVDPRNLRFTASLLRGS